MNLTASTNIDQQPFNEQNDHDIDQLSISSDEEDLNNLSIVSPVSMSQRKSPMIFQNEITPSFFIEESSNNTYSNDTNRIYPSDQLLSTKQNENEPHTSKTDKEPRSTAIKRKRKQHQSSSSSITTTKQSTRIAAKRA